MVQTAKKIVKKPIPKSQQDMGAHRLLVLPTGQLGFVGKGACKSLGLTPSKIKSKHAREIFQFTSVDDALISSPFNLKDGVDPWIQSIRAGTHTLLNTKGEEVRVQFDQIVSDSSIFVVASLIDTDSTKDGAPLEEWIESTLVSEKPKKKSVAKKKPKITQDNISKSKSDVGAQAFMNLSNDVMMSCTSNGYIQDVNTKFSEVLGYTQEQREKLSFIDMIHPEDRAQIRPVFMNIGDEEEAFEQVVDFEARVVSRQGQSFPMEWKLIVQDNIVYIVGQDLSVVKDNEQTLTSQKTLLSEAQSIGHMGHWTWHMDTHAIEWSDEIYKIFGVEQADFQPSIETLTRYLNRRDVGKTMQAFQRAMIEKRDYEMEFGIKRPSGEERFIKCQGRCKVDSEGEVMSLFGIMQDVTEQISHERELQAAKESVERAYNAKSQFLANMSHELRTPLNAIIGFSEMMQRQLLGPIGTEKYLDYIGGIRESGEHLLDLISDILDMSKMEAGKYELVTEDVNIGKVIGLAVHMMEGRAIDNNLKITTDIETEDIVMTADRRAITQVLLNLLSNAVKFTKENGQVSVSCQKIDDKVEIKVEDDGIGIPAMKLNSITNPFEQVSCQYTRDHEGSGLGLAITKELVELHGGVMEIQSKVDVGTSVIIRLPV